MLTETRDFTTEDMDYVHHGDRSLKLRLFKPAGKGPFPLVIDLHGGAWNKGDLTGCQNRDEVLAQAGLAVAALDFRQAADGYLACMADINYATRWVKAHVAELDIDPGRVGLCGQSSGAHLAMLSAMRPWDERYCEIALKGDASSIDATVKCVGMAWPVMNPLSRYRHALRCRAAGGEQAKWVTDIPESHDRYWVTEENMEEGNPVTALEKGEKVQLPPALWVQGKPDIVHDYRDIDTNQEVNEPERFVNNYRKAGGDIVLLYIDYPARETVLSHDPLARFFRKHLS